LFRAVPTVEAIREVQEDHVKKSSIETISRNHPVRWTVFGWLILVNVDLL
jgi:hypothetical protein